MYQISKLEISNAYVVQKCSKFYVEHFDWALLLKAILKLLTVEP